MLDNNREVKPTIIAIDLETTGLSPKINQILEVAMHELDDELNIISSFYGILPHKEIQINITEKVRAMHTANGLLVSEPTTTLHKVQLWLNKYESIIFLGNSVSFDKNFILEHMPILRKKIHYRIIDTSSFNQLVPITLLVPNMSKPNRHRAQIDILYSIELARIYRNTLMKAIMQ